MGAVVTKVDRPVGRGRGPVAPAVKEAALSLDLPCLQPEKLGDPVLLAALEAVGAEVGVVVAYGKILPPEILALPRHGCWNLHFSLLPKWRGAAPVQRAIEAGDRVTGVTVMRMDEGLDTGPILLQRPTEIDDGETAPELTARLTEIGADLLLEALDALAEGEAVPRAQDDDDATWAPRVEKAEGLVDWRLTPSRQYDRWRAFQPWPGLWTEGPKGRVVLEEIQPGEGSCEQAAGTLVGEEGEAAVVCSGGGRLLLARVKPAGRKVMSGKAAINGRYLEAGRRLAGRDAE